MTKRWEWIDIARCIGIFTIVFGHTVLGNSASAHFVSSFRVSLFFLLMGITFSVKGSISDSIKKRSKRLLLPYSVFALISILIFSVLGKYVASLGSFESTDILKNICGALYGNGHTGYMKWNLPLWFLPCSFVSIMIIEFFERGILNCKSKTKIIARIIFITVSFIINLVYCKYFKKIKLPFQSETAILMVSFIEVGILFSEYMKTKHEMAPITGIKGLILSFILLAAGSYTCSVNGTVSVMSLNYGNNIAVFWLTALILCTGVIILSMQLSVAPEIIKKALTYTGKHTIAILCMHKFPIVFFQSFIPLTKNYLLSETDGIVKNIIGVGISVIVIVACLIVELPINKIAPWLFGVKKQKN